MSLVICHTSMRIATLDDATEWTLSLAVARDGGAPVDITARVKFSEDAGYEPPQGRVVLQVVLTTVGAHNLRVMPWGNTVEI